MVIRLSLIKKIANTSYIIATIYSNRDSYIYDARSLYQLGERGRKKKFLYKDKLYIKIEIELTIKNNYHGEIIYKFPYFYIKNKEKFYRKFNKKVSDLMYVANTVFNNEVNQ